MLISMTPNEEVKTIHASLNDGSLRKWEFEPYTENGKIELTDQDYAAIQSIKGNTVKFNQLIAQQYSITLNRDSARTENISTNYTKPIVNHKYYIAITITEDNSQNGINFEYGTIFSLKNIGRKSIIFTAYSSNLSYIYAFIGSGEASGTQISFKDIVLHDLTAIFGSGNEPSTVEAFETWLSTHIGLLPYYDYTPGSLISFNGTGLKTVGKNLFNSTNGELNYWYDAAGNKTIIGLPASSYICEKISVSSNNYTFKANGSNISFLYSKSFVFFDNNNNFVARLHSAGNGQFSINVPDNASYFVVQVYNNTNRDITSYINDWKIQVETGTQATLYEPYTSNTLSLPISTYFPTGMKDSSVTYEVVDELTNSEATTKVVSVDLGNLNWEAKASVNSNYRMQSSSIADIVKKPSTSYILANIICAKYKTITGADAYNEVVGIGIDADGNIRVYDTNYNTSTSAEAFKQSVSGIYLYYELATPTEQDISLDLTYPIWDNGTEQILPVNGSTPTTSPMVATIEYPDRTEDVDFLYKQTTFESNIPQFSLVCKNQELPMTLEDGKLICECDSSITNESGFFDCKVKMQDLESVAYSQKIQLHVERGIND